MASVSAVPSRVLAAVGRVIRGNCSSAIRRYGVRTGIGALLQQQSNELLLVGLHCVEQRRLRGSMTLVKIEGNGARGGGAPRPSDSRR